MPVSRREFLKSLAIVSLTALLAPAEKLLASEDISYSLEAYLSAMDSPFTAPLNTHFENIIQRQPAGLLLYDMNNARLLTALNAEHPLPIASAFKAPLLMYFVDTVSPDVWNRVSVEYWNASSSNELPDALRDNWQEHRNILRALYQTLVLSDNQATGTVLSYVAQVQDSDDAITLFNDWARHTVGISQLSGLSAWNAGIVDGYTFVDERYMGRETTMSSQLVTFDNMMTPRDLGLFYVWMMAHMTPDQQRVCKQLLSTIHDDRGANLERLATERDGTPYSKNGSLSTDAGYVISDAGLIELPDDRLYLLVVQSVDPDDDILSIVPRLFEELGHTLNGRYNEILHNQRNDAVSSEELLAAYTAHLAQAYPQQHDSEPGLYRYGFIIPEGVQVFASPDENDELHNPIIKSTRFGIRLLMQGALVRFVDVNQQWIELMPDDDRDNVRSRLGLRIFVKRSDVWSIALHHADPIPYLIDSSVTASDKFIVINVVGRELIAFEGAVAVMRLPIVLNPDATPRGAQIITSKWFARSMQPWAPGVPFTSFFGNDGYALHGSPWQRWGTTVNQGNIGGRTSAGCVNVPDWMITIGDYTRPADELLFRWIGGMETPNEHVFNYPSSAYPALRIFSVDHIENLHNYYRPEGMVARNMSWDDVIAALETIPLQAPDSFFV